ncbi:ATP-binding cassette domain-containing protein [Candidatus Chloroploca mongolica]|uniref:ATP-binding cassette domain-containing protein n=1 Tax=Candidatus Chloroploca mongolica TaxID=2528176 RepID=UPI001081C921|nr:ATP-binding cassette domain-containing protein [Candidatus Chloroploca mongolica]
MNIEPVTPQPQPHQRRLLPPRLVRQAPLLELRGLSKRYGRIVAVQGVNLELYPGETVGIVGESGSGKSTVLRMLNLEEATDTGTYHLAVPGFTGQNLFALDRFHQRQLRIQQIGIVYQQPHMGLRMQATSGGNVAERLIMAGERRFATLRRAASDALASSEFPADRIDDPPAVLSGGMQQRVQLAKAIALRPALLLLDEPTTGLDVSIQALVLDTLLRLRRERQITTLIVSHDLGVIRTLADRVLVMRHGAVVECGLTDQILDDPQHPYTQQLVSARL